MSVMDGSLSGFRSTTTHRLPRTSTICTHERICLFGDVIDGHFVPTEAGRIVEEVWQGLPERFEQVLLDAYVVMPNHFHGLVRLKRGPRPLGNVVRAFKAISTRLIRMIGLEYFGWQTNYHEHLVRDDASMDHIRRYIRSNPRTWEQDVFHPIVEDIPRLSTAECRPT